MRQPLVSAEPPRRRSPSRRSAPETKAVAEGLAAPPRVACRIVSQIALEVAGLAVEQPLRRRDGRRHASHIRQIAMYVCHVVLRLSLSDIGHCFGRDRTTVSHACNVVEDRRDDAAFDALVASIERIVAAVFGPAGMGGHE